jgi:hypothetical protein
MSATSSPYVLETPNLRVVFSACGDRQGHDVFVKSGTEWLRRFASQEGTSDDAWPISPAIQEIHVHRAPTGKQLLGVGMAGKSHWSLSISPEGSGAILFDVACRVRGVPHFLGSTYLDIAHVTQTLSPHSSANLSLPGTICWRYRFRPDGTLGDLDFPAK